VGGGWRPSGDHAHTPRQSAATRCVASQSHHAPTCNRYVLAQLPLDYQPVEELYCVRAVYRFNDTEQVGEQGRHCSTGTGPHAPPPPRPRAPCSARP